MKPILDPPLVVDIPENSKFLLHRWFQQQGYTITTACTILHSILDSIGDGIMVVNELGQIVHLNPAACQILSDDPTSMLTGQAHGAIVCYLPDRITPYAPEQLPLTRAIRGQISTATEVFLCPDTLSNGKWLSITAQPLCDEYGTLHGGVAILRDISASRQAETALRESEERYALAARGANDGLWDWNLATNQIYLSPRWKSMLGYTEEEIGNRPEEWFDRVHPDDQERVQLHLIAHFKGLITHFENEHRMIHHDGSYRWMLCRGLAVRDTNGQTTRMAGSQTDITDRKQAEEQLVHGALHDALTGLPNRALFIDRLERAITHTKQNPAEQFAVLFLDIDRFKVINDSLGHPVGDQMLVAFAQRLSPLLRPEYTLARLGGDEFTILLEHIPHVEEATHLAASIQKELAVPFYLHNHEIVTTASIGIAQSSMGYEHPEDMVRDADTAMYRAKALGKACYVVFDTTMHAYAIEMLQLEADLRRAIERQEFHVYYQPIVSLATGRIAGFEALIRWHHPQYGCIAPGDFIPLAEETGLIIPIGQWILHEACRQMYVWQQQFPKDPPLSISVNISSKQFTQADLVKQIVSILDTTGLAPHCLKLEITESVLMEYGETTIALLQKLRTLGVQLSIDDFGTGYSSLSYLQRFPINTLKIDRSFIQGIDAHHESINIVQTILTLARMLGIDTIAEGTETADQVRQLRSLQCDYIQGWWFSGAVDSETALALLVNETQDHQPDALERRLQDTHCTTPHIPGASQCSSPRYKNAHTNSPEQV